MDSGLILPYQERSPFLGEGVFVAPGAKVIGDVHIGAASSIWFNAVVRGDVHHIRIGARVNIQDLSMVHVTHGAHPTIIEDDVTVGHRVILHGCHVSRHCLIGMGAVIMDRAHIGEHCLIGAGALVTEGTIIPPGTLALGAPARARRDLTDAELAEVEQAPLRYARYASEYLKAGVGVR